MAIGQLGLAGLRASTRGRLITPDDPAYDATRSTFNALADGRPLAILQPVDLDDVVAAVRWAGDAGVGMGVRGGGHSVAGHSAPEGGLLVDLSMWRGAEVDPAQRTSTALGGSRLMDLDAATAAHDLAAPSGTFVDTGIAGLTLGGGISYLIGSEGFACDALIGAQLVTANGEVVEVDEEREPDLLWALRGGGGNFGIVTRLRYRLTAVPQVAGGYLRFRGEGIHRALERVLAIERQAPDALCFQAVAARSGIDGAPVLTVIVAWRGDPAEGQASCADLVGDVSFHEGGVRAMSWLQLQAMNTPMAFGQRHYWKGHLVGEAGHDLAEAVLNAGASAGVGSIVLVELIHGAAHRIPASSAAFGGRAAAANVTALAHWSDPADDASEVEWARTAAASFEPFSLRGGGYLNYPELDQSASRVAAAFGPEAFARLRTLKRRHDPDNRFRFNANIPPAEA